MFARNYFPDVTSEDEYTIDFPYLDTDDLIFFKNGIETAMPANTTFVYDKDTGETLITMGTAQSAALVEIRRRTGIQTDLDDYIKRSEDSQYGSSLVMGVQPINVEGLYILQEMQDEIEVGQDLLVPANVALTDGTYQLFSVNRHCLVKDFSTVLQGVLTTNNAVLTTKINTTNITGGTATVTASGAAVGDVDVAAGITAANRMAPGDYLAVAVSGTPGATKTAEMTVTLTPLDDTLMEAALA